MRITAAGASSKSHLARVLLLLHICETAPDRTSSARAMSCRGTSIPSVRAVWWTRVVSLPAPRMANSGRPSKQECSPK